MKYINMGEKIKQLRNAHHLTQDQLSNRLGLTKSVISAYETSLRCPSYAVLIKLAGMFRVSTDYLLGVEKLPAVSIADLSEKNQRLIFELIAALKENP